MSALRHSDRSWLVQWGFRVLLGLVVLVGTLPLSGVQASAALQKVRYMYFPTAHSAVIFVAKEQGFFEAEGLDVELIQGSSGIGMMNALMAGEVEFTNNPPYVIGLIQARGRFPIIVYPYTTRATLEMVVSNSLMEREGVTPDSPLMDRMRALGRATIGVTSPNSESDIFGRYFIRQAGLDPDRDATIVSVAGAPGLLAAFRTGQIDAFMLTPPSPNVMELEGLGKVLISLPAGDVPEFSDFVYQSVVVMRDYAERNPDVVVRFIRALMKADHVLRTDKETTLDALAAYLPGARESLSVAYDRVSPAWTRPSDTRLNEERMRAQIALNKKVGLLEVDVSPAEGVLWTNRYRDEAYAGL